MQLNKPKQKINRNKNEKKNKCSLQDCEYSDR